MTAGTDSEDVSHQVQSFFDILSLFHCFKDQHQEESDPRSDIPTLPPVPTLVGDVSNQVAL